MDEIVRTLKQDRTRLRRWWLAKPSREQYFGAITELQDHKLDLDRLWRNLEVVEEVLPDLGLEGTHKDAQVMEHYLTDLVRESEKVAKRPVEDFDPPASP